jgi:myo-inositol-1(or 4)-monophosphatase
MNREVEQVAQQAVAEVGSRIREAWARPKRVEHKGVVDLVTETDREVEELVVARIRRAFPDHLIIAEESSVGKRVERPPADRYAWYIDPLDGTTNFAHGYPVFAVSLALARGDDLRFGMVHDPLREETFVAHSGDGATLNGAPIHVSSVDDIDGALLATGFPYDRRSRADFYLGFFKDFMERAQGIRRAGAAAIDLCWLACGRLDGFWEWKLHPWDTAAGALIVREAGGTVTDFRGGTFDPHGDQTLASNGLVHRAMIDVLRGRLTT